MVVCEKPMKQIFLGTIAALSLSLFAVPSLGQTSAVSWGQTTGALVGMSSACGYELSRTWMRNIVQKRRDLSTGASDFDAATALFEDYAKRAYVLQNTNPPMTCEDAIRMAKDSELKCGE